MSWRLNKNSKIRLNVLMQLSGGILRIHCSLRSSVEIKSIGMQYIYFFYITFIKYFNIIINDEC
jgi:hypothetical protein